MSRETRKPYFGISLAVSSLIALLFAAGLRVPTARAVPSFSRQTGFPCSSCHTSPPELTPLGRAFKLGGYTLAGTAINKVEKTGQQKSGLSLLQVLPLSVFFDTSFTSLNKPIHDTQNGSFEFPQDVSLFLAGEWSTHVGSFVQFTYDTQDDHFSWDITDIRYANSRKLGGKDFMYGLTLNNGPTIEDLWHSTPAWSFPFANDDFAPTPAAASLVDGSLAQDVGGLGAYGMWNNHLYVAASMYRSQHIGAAQPLDGADALTIRGVAPYWRVAWQQSTANNYLMVGTYGMHVNATPGAVTGVPQDHFTDVAFDFQYDRTIPSWHNNVLSIRGTYIRENSTLNNEFDGEAADVLNHHLNTIKANAEYHFGNRYTGTFGYFNTTGTRDFTFYNPDCEGPCEISGSASGSPQSSGLIFNVAWWPVQNIDLAAQYTKYLRFNGGSTNYDGNGRNAGDNNTVFLLARFVF